jgi:ribosomal protein S18 acetylase RimI-like enzyme
MILAPYGRLRQPINQSINHRLEYRSYLQNAVMKSDTLSRLAWILLALIWRAASFSVKNALFVTQVRTNDDWHALADVRYDEWIRDIGGTSRSAFRQATIEIYQEERPESILVLAKLNDKVVGAAELSPIELENVLQSDSVKAMYITDVVTDSNYRRRGVGQTLIEALEEEAVKQKSNYIVLHVMPENMPALDFYKTLGFAEPCMSLSSILDYKRLAENAGGAEGQVLLSKTVLK